MAAEKMNGKWKMKSSDKFDEYMKALGVNVALRKIGNAAKPSLTITLDETSFHYKSESTLRSMEMGCKIGVECDEKTSDGRNCKTIVQWEGDKLVQTQKWNGKTSTITRFIDENGELIIDCVIDDIVCRRIYTKA